MERTQVVEKVAAASGKRTTNSLPWPGPSLVCLDHTAVPGDKATNQRQTDSQATGGPTKRMARLKEHVEYARQHCNK